MYWIENLWRSRTSFLSPSRTNPLSKNYISEVFSISKQISICFTNMYFSTSFSINKSYRFFCQHLSLTFPRNRSYIYICSCIFFLHQTILQQSYIVESVLFQLFSLTFFYCRELVFSYPAIDTSSTPVSFSCPDLCKILDYEINLITPVWLGGEDWWISNKSTSLTFRSPTISAPQM